MTSIMPQEEVSLLFQPRWMSLESYSLLLLLYSAITYSIMASLIKLATETGIPSTELVFLRALVQGFLVVFAMFFYSDDDDGIILIRKPFGGSEVRWVVATRGLVGGIGFLLYSYAMSALPIGDAMTLIAMSPIITFVTANLALHEPFQLIHIFAALASFTASVLMAKPSFLFSLTDQNGGNMKNETDKYDITGYIAALCRACCGAAVHVLIRRAGKVGVHTLHLLFSWALFAALFSWLLLVLPEDTVLGKTPTFAWPTSSVQWMYVWGVIILGSIGNLLFNYAARKSPAGKNSIMRSSSILWSYLLEIAIFHQVPDRMTTVGVCLVVCSLLAITLSRKGEKNDKDAKTEASVSETTHLIAEQGTL
mmetsp:Transcript_38612/g.93350  ORF Transcript_38612/g.93350 Transcript_38612/m.93350 type:complete len:366 (-) Transcript_38612:230-1327(-)